MRVFLFLLSLWIGESWSQSSTAYPTTSSATPTTTEAPVICPDDWFDAAELGCFKFLDTKLNLTWVDAQTQCEQIGGYLAEPITSRQSEFLKEVALLEASFTGIGYWYIGLTDLSREGDWLWIHSGVGIQDSSYWGTNKPNHKPRNTDDCGVMVVKNNQFSWEDHNCEDPEVSHHPVAPICQQETTISQTTTMGTTLTSTPPLQCPDDYTQFQGHCYKFYGSPSTYWTRADAYCLGYGGRLASVHSSEEDDFIRDLAGGNSYWMGGYPSGNTWVWSDGTAYDYVGNAYDMDTGECIAYRNGYGWYTYSCTSDNIYYVCKI